MIKVYGHKPPQTEIPCSISEFLNCKLEGPNPFDPHSQGNCLDLLKLITAKLHAAKIVSDQELLDVLGGDSEWNNPHFKAEENEE